MIDADTAFALGRSREQQDVVSWLRSLAVAHDHFAWAAERIENDAHLLPETD